MQMRMQYYAEENLSHRSHMTWHMLLRGGGGWLVKGVDTFKGVVNVGTVAPQGLSGVTFNLPSIQWIAGRSHRSAGARHHTKPLFAENAYAPEQVQDMRSTKWFNSSADVYKLSNFKRLWLTHDWGGVRGGGEWCWLHPKGFFCARCARD